MKEIGLFLWFAAACIGAVACSSMDKQVGDDVSTDEAEKRADDKLDTRLVAAVNRSVGKQTWVPLNRPNRFPQRFEAGHLFTHRDKIALSADNSGFYAASIDVEGTSYVQLTMDDTAIGGEAGSPALPFKGLYLEVPYGVAPEAVVTSKNTTTTTLSKPVYPKQPSPIDSSDVVPAFVKNVDAYQQDKLFPQSIVEIVKDGFIRGRRTIFLEIHPLQYNPVTGELLIHSDIAIDINLHGSWDTAEAKERDRLSSSSFEQQAERLIMNYNEIVAFPSNSTARALAASDALGNAADYLIIAADDFVEEVAPLATWKREKGYITKVVPMSDIGSTSTDIENYIQDAYDTWSPAPTYVLFVGDVDDIPSYPVSPDAHGDAFVSDLTYSLTDGSDYWPDVALGRLSVSTEAECATVVNKILSYDKTPSAGSWYESSLVTAYFQDSDDSDCEADRYFLETAVHAYDYLYNVQGQTLYTSFVNGNTCSEYAYRLDSDWFPHRPAHPDYVPSDIVSQFLDSASGTAAISAAINSGVGLVLHRDHGKAIEWGDPPYDVSDVLALSNGNMTPVVLSINCLTGAFDNSTDSFAEVFQTRSDGGAVGIVAAVRVSYSGPNDSLVHGLFTSFWPDYDSTHSTTDLPNTFRMADVMNFAKHYMYIYQGDTTDTEYEFQLFHWFGDPEMEYRPVSPVEYSIVVPEEVSPNDTAMTVGGAPSGAVVGITQGNEVLGRAVSDGGNTIVPLSEIVDNATPLLVTVTNYNMMPFQADVQLSSIELTLPETVEEGDGVLVDAGTVELPAPAIGDAVVTLTSGDTSEITVPATVTIPSGQSSATFDITVLDDTDIDVVVAVTITASTPEEGVGTGAIVVVDDEPVTVWMDFESDVTEGDGTVAGHGTISTSDNVTRNVTFDLTSSDVSELTVSETVTVAAGANSATFDVTVVDDILLDGPQSVTVTAGVAGWIGASGGLSVLDNDVEQPSLAITVPDAAFEGALLENGGSVTIPSPLYDDLVVQLSSSDESELTVPAFVTILQGETGVDFDIVTIDDGVEDGNHAATITAASPGWQPASTSMTVMETVTLPYYQDFSEGLPGETEGFEYYSSNNYGRIQVYNDELLMDSSYDNQYVLNEAILTLDMRAFENITLEFEHTTYIDENDELPEQYTGNEDGDGVSISNDGETWYTIANASALSSTLYTIDLDNELDEIRTTYDASFGYNEAFRIKFQQYDNHQYGNDGRGWDDIAVYGEALGLLTLEIAPTSATEGDGVLVDQASVRVDVAPSIDVTVSLSAALADELSVPSTVVIPAGDTTVDFDISVLDDTEIDGTQTVTVAASAAGYVKSFDSIDIIDDEMATISLVVPATLSETDGVVADAGSLTLGGTTPEDLIVSLSSDDTSELSVPSTVVISAGHNAVRFDVTAVDDTVVDGDQTVTVTASASGFTSDAQPVVVIDNDLPSLGIDVTPNVVSESDGVLSNAGTIILPEIAEGDVVITLVSSDSAGLTVPATVTVAAGQIAASFDVTIVDDTLLDGDESVFISATADGYTGVRTTVTVQDDETGVLSLTITHESATEGDGVLTGVGTVTSNVPVAGDIVVTLTTDRPDEISVPSGVTIPAGADSVLFDIIVVDDTLIDGTQTAKVTAEVRGWTADSDSLDILDNEATLLGITLPASAVEGSKVASNGNVAISGTLTSDLSVALVSGDTSEITVPSSVVIPAGQTNVDFTLTVVDDTVTDGDQSVDITATAIGFPSATGTIEVVDDDPDHFEFATTIADQENGMPFDVTITAVDASGKVMEAFDGVATLSSAGDSGTVSVSPRSLAFLAGEWRGVVTITSVDTNVTLQVDDGFGHLGVSNSFDVTDVIDDLSGDLTLIADWGTGYCATLDVTNNTDMPTTDWIAIVDTQSTEIYNQWNGDFSGNNGMILIMPVGWNNIINPGVTDRSVGFCADRLSGGSDVTTVESVIGIF